MLYSSRVEVCEFFEASDRRNVWHGEMPICYHNSIKSLFPPVVELISTLTEHKPPFLTMLLRELHRSVVFYEVLVASSIDQILDILPDYLV